MKFLGVPPPMYITPVSLDLRDSNAVSCTSATTSKRNFFPCVLAARPIPIEGSCKGRDIVTEPPELRFGCKDIVDSVHTLLLEQDVIHMGITLEVEPAKRLMDIMEQVCPCGYQTIDHAVLDQIGDDTSHPGRDHGASQAQEDAHPSLQHRTPYIHCCCKIPGLKGGMGHRRQGLGYGHVFSYFKGDGRVFKEFGSLHVMYLPKSSGFRFFSH